MLGGKRVSKIQGSLNYQVWGWIKQCKNCLIAHCLGWCHTKTPWNLHPRKIPHLTFGDWIPREMIVSLRKSFQTKKSLGCWNTDISLRPVSSFIHSGYLTTWGILFTRWLTFVQTRRGSMGSDNFHDAPCRCWTKNRVENPPNHPFVHRVFHYKPSILGVFPLFLETPMSWLNHFHCFYYSVEALESKIGTIFRQVIANSHDEKNTKR